jgi:hypothetical protein
VTCGFGRSHLVAERPLAPCSPFGTHLAPGRYALHLTLPANEDPVLSEIASSGNLPKPAERVLDASSPSVGFRPRYFRRVSTARKHRQPAPPEVGTLNGACCSLQVSRGQHRARRPAFRRTHFRFAYIGVNCCPKLAQLFGQPTTRDLLFETPNQ